jgi:hypothetical protein
MLFWNLYKLEFKDKKITLNSIKKFLEMTGIEDYHDINHTFYELYFFDVRKWHMFKMKHGICFNDDEDYTGVL